MTGVLAAASTSAATHATNYTVVFVAVGIPLVVFATLAVILWAWFNLQGRRADAVAMASYRKLAEDAVANQQELRNELIRLTLKVDAVEKLMRDVG
jgi:hypothetical protein